MKALFTRFAAVAFGFLAAGVLNARLVVNNSNDGEALASQIVGAGVSISNVVFDCAPGSAGIFSKGNTTNIGLNEGIILTTGAASDAIGPNITGSTWADPDFAFHGDPDLQEVVAFNLQGACALSVDFIADADVLTVQYSFASEEYNEYGCSQFNDAFAFFVSGPNPLGRRLYH